MSTRAASWLAWSLAGLSMAAMFVASVVLTLVSLSVATPDTQQSSDWGVAGALGGLMIFLPFLAFPIVGALIASTRPRNPIGWICLTAGLFWMLIVVGDSGILRTTTIPGQYAVTIDALTQWTWVPPVGLLGIYLILLFPDGRLPSRRWRPLAWFSGAVIVLVSVALTIIPGPLPGHPGVKNPFGIEGYPMAAQALGSVVVLLPLCILASAASLIFRYRRSNGETRQQIKLVAFAASLVGATYLVTLVSLLILAPDDLASERMPFWATILTSMLLISYASVPVAIGIAILRYQLYDIDVLINRAVVYGSLTVTLALLYFGGVATTQVILRALTGQEQQPQLAVVASTVVIAALFAPLRRRVQFVIDRRFYRRKYDARKTLEAFAAKLRDETNLDALNDDLLGVVRETMQPAHVSLWLRPANVFQREQVDQQRS